MQLKLLVAQQNAISAALLQRPKEALCAMVDRGDVVNVLRTAAAMNLMLARQNGAGSVLLLPMELDQLTGEGPVDGGTGAAAGGAGADAAGVQISGEGAAGERGGGFALRVQRVPDTRPLPKATKVEESERAVLKVRDGTTADKLAASIVGGVLEGEQRRVEVPKAALLPVALQAVARARARLLENRSGLDLGVVVYVARREGDERGGGEGQGGQRRREEEGAKGKGRGWEHNYGPPVYTLRLVTLEGPKVEEQEGQEEEEEEEVDVQEEGEAEQELQG